MHVEEILLKYQKLGVEFYVEGDKLRYSALKGVMNEDAKEEVRKYKTEIMRYLSEHSEKVICDSTSKYLPFPLTDIQSAYLVGRNESYKYGGVGCKIYSEFLYDQLDVERFNSAWKKVVNSNDMLHAVINENGTQQILEEYSIPNVKIWKLNSLTVGEIEQTRKKIRDRMTKKQYQPGEWPLFDVELSQTDDNIIMHFSLDMLMADFSSINIIMNELEKYYEDKDAILQKSVSYRDIINYKVYTEKQPKHFEQRKNDETYWKTRIPNMPEGTQLPITNRPETASIYQLNTFICPERVRELSEFAKNNKLTLSTIILSLYIEVIRYWSESKDFCVNITMTNRPDIHPEIDDIVGDFTVVDILESRYMYNSKLVDRMKKVQEQLWEDVTHLSFTGVEVLRELNKGRKEEIIIPYVYTSTLGLQENEKLDFGNKDRGKLIYKISQTPQVLIDCQVMDYDGGILVNWDIRENVFPEDMAEAAFEAFSNILNHIEIEQFEAQNNLAMLPEKMKNVRKNINSTYYEWKEVSLIDGFCENVKKNPNKIAVITNDVSYSYKELGQYAVAVQKELIFRRLEGKIIAVAMRKGIWQIASVLGILLAGGTYLPIDIEQPQKRRRKIIESSGASAMILESTEDNSFIDTVKIYVDQLAYKTNYEIKSIKNDINQPAYIIYTSGSTGEPKGVIISHAAAMNTIQDIIARFSITSNDKVLCVANLAFDLSVFDVFGILTAGGTLVVPTEEKNVREWYELLNKHNVTIWNTVPAQMQMLVSYCKAEHIHGDSKLRLIMLSGDWIPVKLPKQITEIFSNASIESLGGATEASIWSIAYPIDSSKEYKKSIPYGFPLSNQEFYILDENLNDCPDWVKGEIYIAGMGLASGYLNDEKLTKEKFIYHPQREKRMYKTGDYGRYYPNGLIEFLGREDSQIKIRGHRVELNEIEANITSMPEIENAIVLSAKEDTDLLGAFVQPITEDTNEDEIKRIIIESNEKICSNTSLFQADIADYKKWVNISNKTALSDIIKTFMNAGIFVNSNKWYTLEEIYNNTEVHEYYRPLIRRWLKALKQEEYIEEKNKKEYKIKLEVSKDEADQLWEQWLSIDKKVNYSPIMMQYFKESRENLAPLLQGKLDPVDLFFPKGKFTVALSAYKDNIVSKCMNSAIIENVIGIAEAFKKKRKRKLRIIEIGAGVGGVSIDLISAISEYPVEYLFTDISRSFLNEAQEKFKKYPWVDYALFDINKEYWKQNIDASAWDIILCNNVLHNANDELKVLKQFKEMATPNGLLIILDATGINYTLLTSMEFHNGLNGVEDFRSENEQVFLSTAQWEDQFNQAGMELLSQFPPNESPLEILGQTLFIGRFSSKRKLVNAETVKRYLSKKLPDYMIPAYIQILKEFPMTLNGKIDRKKLQQMVEMDNPFIPLKGEEPITDLEKRVADIWKESLKREAIWRNENFYEAGGDSLLVAQVVAKMKETIPEANSWEWDKLMIALIDTPTVEEICKKLEDKMAENSIENTDTEQEVYSKNLTYISNDEESNRLVVLVHDGTGTKSPYDILVKYLQPDLDSLSILVCSNMEEYLTISENDLIFTLGEKYAHELIDTGKEEFILIGYCMGGLISLEIGKVLSELGKKVYPIISIDTTPSKRMIDTELLMERAFGMVIGADIRKAGHTITDKLLKEAIEELSRLQEKHVPNEALTQLQEEKFKPVVECYSKMVTKSHDERLEDLYSTLEINDRSGIIEYQRMRLDMLYRVFCHSFKAVINYEPGFYIGDAIVLSCEDKDAAFLPVEEMDNENFWKSTVIGNIEMKQIKGNHLNCLSEPYAQQVANIILEYIKK